MPNVDPKILAEIGPFLRFGELLGRLISQLAPARANVLRINYSGKVGSCDTTLISRAVLKGFLERAMRCGAGELHQRHRRRRKPRPALHRKPPAGAERVQRT